MLLLSRNEIVDLPLVAQSFFTPEALQDIKVQSTESLNDSNSSSLNVAEMDSSTSELKKLREKTLKKFSALGKGDLTRRGVKRSTERIAAPSSSTQDQERLNRLTTLWDKLALEDDPKVANVSLHPDQLMLSNLNASSFVAPIDSENQTLPRPKPTVSSAKNPIDKLSSAGSLNSPNDREETLEIKGNAPLSTRRPSTSLAESRERIAEIEEKMNKRKLARRESGAGSNDSIKVLNIYDKLISIGWEYSSSTS